MPALASFVVMAGLVAVAADVEVATSVAFTEGPAVDAAGNVYFCETQSRRIWKLATDGGRSIFRESSNRANGLVFDDQGRLLAAETGERSGNTPPRVTRTNIETGEIEVLADRYDGRRFNAPNDITVDGKGRIYFTDQGGREARDPEVVGLSGVYRIDPDGQITRILAAPDIERPNGVIISPDDRTLYLVESNQSKGGKRMIRAYDLEAIYEPGKEGSPQLVPRNPNASQAALCVGLWRR